MSRALRGISEIAKASGSKQCVVLRAIKAHRCPPEAAVVPNAPLRHTSWGVTRVLSCTFSYLFFRSLKGRLAKLTVVLYSAHRALNLVKIS